MDMAEDYSRGSFTAAEIVGARQPEPTRRSAADRVEGGTLTHERRGIERLQATFQAKATKAPSNTWSTRFRWRAVALLDGEGPATTNSALNWRP